jgi:NADPH-dependent 2,4-dienoyl-CoA reductase/sulfur reductase-like enzyme/rhodanese-related sulfurtransferase
MKILIIGAVAAGTSAAAKARRNDETAEITIYERDPYISYSGCGMPYYIGGHVSRFEDLVPRDPEFFKSKYNTTILTMHEVLAIDPSKKALQVKNLNTGEVFTDYYDQLVLATGAGSVMPPIEGIKGSHVFSLRNIVDMNKIMAFIKDYKPQKAAIIGTGFIGLELCENLIDIGISVTLIEKLPQVTPGLDADMAVYVQEHIESKGIKVITNADIALIDEKAVKLVDGQTVDADLVIVATGVRPKVDLAVAAGIVLGETGAIKVNKRMQTSAPGIYACGDCIEHYQLVTGKPVFRPLGSTANKTGRIAGDCVTGGTLEFRGILGTGIFRIFGLAVAQTGLSEREAKAQGIEVTICHNIKPDKPEYMGGKDLTIKAIADSNTGRLLGVQIIGEAGVSKRIDVFATAITFGAKAEDLFHLDLAYAPPFSTTKDPVMYTGMILDNAINKGRKLMTADQLEALMRSGEQYNLIDARIPEQYNTSHIQTARNIPHEKLRQEADTLDKEAITITYCNKGITGNATQNILLNKGFKKVYNVSGGHKTYSKSIAKPIK